MKRCPNCNDMALYEDAEIVCPICHSALVRYSINTGSPVTGSEPPQGGPEPLRRRKVVTADTSHATEKRTRQSIPQDERRPTTEPSRSPWTEDRPQASQHSQRNGRRVVDPVTPLRASDGNEDYNDRSENRRTVRPRAFNSGTANRPPQFDEPVSGRQHIFRGRVAEVNSHSRYYNRFHKIVNMVFRREPYQFGNASYETVIRIEEFAEGRLPSQWRDLVIYGDVENSVHVGDDVVVHAVQSGGRYVIRNLHNNQTESDVVPGPQMSVLAGVLLVAAVVAIFATLIYGIYAFFTKGGFDALVMALVNLALAIFVKLLPIFVIFFIFSLLTGIGRKH